VARWVPYRYTDNSRGRQHVEEAGRHGGLRGTRLGGYSHGGDRRRGTRQGRQGHTGQGRTIRLKVRPQQVEIKAFSIQLRCSGGYVLIDEESGFLPTSISRGGRIRDRQFGSTDEVLIRGHVAAHAVRGRVRVRDRLGKHRCSSPWVRFTAHR
jgi:hypothetical protein